MSDPRDKHRAAPAADSIPDLDLPVPRASSPNISSPVEGDSFGDGFGVEIERGPAVSAPPASAPRSAQQRAAIDASMDFGGDDFGMEIERGGAVVSLPSGMSSGHPSSGPASRPGVSARPHVSGIPAGSGLDIAYQRADARPRSERTGPSLLERLAANAVSAIAFGLAMALLIKLVHRSGGRDALGLLPHAFDATSPTQSGIFSLSALALAIGLGFAGLRMHPRSYAILGSATAVLISALAMVTVTLVATEEHPSPPDGALVIPYLVPLALFLLGLGTVRRGVLSFLDGGVARRVGAVALGALGGAFVFAAIELSALATRLP